MERGRGIDSTEKNLLDTLKSLYRKMDSAWEEAASIYGFQCSGCSENCCETQFYHHTFIERAYLLYGLSRLPSPAVVKALKRGELVNKKIKLASKRGESIRIMCPLNLDEKCIIYPFRPMICRLHGIPHELHPPGGGPRGTMIRPGCGAGSSFFEKGYHTFDRTPFYSEMAVLETEYIRFKFKGRPGKIKQTVSEMIVAGS
ncbi:MAG: hypothetical protein HQK66_04145 [Desulfamplus sp.]|nr:hypothetical protein [Desulfamplus sp.]